MSEDLIVLPLPEDPQLERLLQLKKSFIKTFGTNPPFVARAPGRVNLIGEHVDYCGYSVLPMAIEQDIMIAFTWNDSTEINIANKDNLYPPYKNGNVNAVHIDKSTPTWYNYVLCGFLGITQHFKLTEPVGLNMCIGGTIPPSAGLSSSSALVCAAALATLHANGLTMSKKDLAAVCAKCERYVGTEGGGMDQAIAFLAEAGTAKLIEFKPLRTTDVRLPENATFVIANSCSDVNKASTSDYNTRVVECRIAAQIIAKTNGLDWKQYRKLGEVQEALDIPLAKMAGVVASVLHQAAYTKTEVCDILEISDDELKEKSLSPNTLHLTSFELFKRSMHVFTEADRVWEFKRICENPPANAVLAIGKIMSASHESCRDLYECSHPNLDELVNISLQAGALGSRLTGAGWGGCTVSLVPSDKITSYLEAVRANFYSNSSDWNQNVEAKLFPTQPGSGAAIFKL